MDGTRRKPISNEVVAAYSHCPRKAFLLRCTEERGTPHEYLEILRRSWAHKQLSYFGRVACQPLLGHRSTPQVRRPEVCFSEHVNAG